MPSSYTRNIALTAEWDGFVKERMASGEYGNVSELIRAGLRVLRDGRDKPRAASAGWPIGGGECGTFVRSRDWSATPLGPIEGWSLELRATVANVVNSPVAKVLMWGPEHIMLYNDAYAEIAGDNHPHAFGGSTAEVWPEVWDLNREVLAAGFRGELRSYRDRSVVLHRNGAPEELTFDLFYTPVYEADGRVGGVLCTCVDNSARATAERESAISARRFRTAIDAMHGVLWTNTADGRMEGEQPGWAALTGQAFDDYQGYGWTAAIHPDDAAITVERWQAALARKAMFVHEHRVRRHCGAWRTCAVRALPVLDAAGEIAEWVGVHSDITHQRAAEAALREQADKLVRQIGHRERAEAQLRLLNETLEARVVAEIDERRHAEAKLAQAQKMEAVGNLTGGVAHDFNNLLQVISGNLQLLAKEVSGNDRAERRVANAMSGVERGAKLASQLLAFGRRQALAPKVVNVTRFVRGMDEMLRRAIGEGIAIETLVGEGLWNSFVDPAQIENALLNLAINARDAMNGNGRLTIELGNVDLGGGVVIGTDEVAPGQYVTLAVTDTGSGMAPDIIDKVFEPFFSTKGEGKGSGLGLSMVYGFVRQSGGHVRIRSEIGRGTTVEILLPRALDEEEVGADAPPPAITGGTETVLVVEDDEGVRTTVVEMLGDLGYHVLKAPDATAAMAVIDSGVAIDLLFTDVVMPGPLKSPELARRARERLPELAVLFTSGYCEDGLSHGGRLDQGVELLAKPYTREALARRFRHVLANQRQRRLVVADVATAAATASILVVEDDPLIRIGTADALQDMGHAVIEAGSAEQALAILRTTPIDVLVTDVNLPGGSGLDLARSARGLRPAIGIVFATGDSGAAADACGAERAVMLAKPYGGAGLAAAIGSALDRMRDAG